MLPERERDIRRTACNRGTQGRAKAALSGRGDCRTRNGTRSHPGEDARRAAAIDPSYTRSEPRVYRVLAVEG
jgi:hypothetical protein